MITPLEWVGMGLGSTVAASAVTAWAARRPSMINAFTQSYTDLAGRLAHVEARVDHLDGKLSDEQRAHGRTRGVLATAFRHIREFTAWAAGPRISEPPATPAELLKELL